MKHIRIASALMLLMLLNQASLLAALAVASDFQNCALRPPGEDQRALTGNLQISV